MKIGMIVFTTLEISIVARSAGSCTASSTVGTAQFVRWCSPVAGVKRPRT